MRSENSTEVACGKTGSGAPFEVRQRLAELGLSPEVLLEIVQAIAAAHAACTENDPPAARCWDGWRMGTRRARELLRAEGWEKDDTDTFSVIVSHQTRVRMVVVNSTPGTGLVLGPPLNVARKGPRSRAAARDNHQLVLNLADFLEEYQHRLKMAEAVQYETWCLCAFVDGEIVRAELSQPVSFARGYVTRWEERIILLGDDTPPGVTDLITDEGDDGLSPAFPIIVERK